MKINLKKLLDEYTKDGVIDHKAIQDIVTKNVNDVIAKNKPNMDEIKESLKGESIKDIMKELNIEGVKDLDGFKAHTKRLGASATDLTEANSRLEKENKDLLAKYEETNTNYTGLESKIKGYEQKELIIAEGLKPKYLNAIKAEANALVSDDMDFAGALAQVKESFPEYLVKGNAGGASPKGTPPNPNDTQLDEWKKAAGL